MADLADVMNALVAAVDRVLYPNGDAAPSLLGTPFRIYPGEPVPDQLDADLAAGTINVSVFPLDGEINTTRFPPDWHQATPPAVTLAAAVAGNTVTLSGSVSTPQNLALLVDGKSYVYAVAAADTLATIAAALAALVSADQGASSAGPALTIPGAHRIVARAGGAGTSIREVKRQLRRFRISFWCSDPNARNAAAAPVDAALGGTTFLTLADGTFGRLVYHASPLVDKAEKAALYRRDLVYSVEYGTTQIESDTEIIVLQELLQSGTSRAMLGSITINE